MGRFLHIRCLMGALAFAAGARAQIAAPDSLLQSAPPDSSMATARPDSAAFASAMGDSLLEPTRTFPDAIELPPADFDSRDFESELPEGLDATLRRMAQPQLRVHGERGAASYLSVSPIGEVAPEILVDGIPLRSPADLDPSVFDISSGDLAGIRVGDGHFGGGGDFDLRLTRSKPVLGRTLTRTQFSSTRRETYYRSLALTTPQAPHGLRMNFEEWKSELGVDYADLASASILNFGYAKQRRFQLELRSRTSFGNTLVGFGRGRRRSPGNLLGTTRRADSTERFTGQVYAGLDQYGSTWLRSFRVYQSDAREVDESGGQQLPLPQSAGQRYGLRVEQLSPAAGSSVLLQLERWSAVWNPQAAPRQRARGRWMARGGIAHELRLDAAWSLRAGARADWAEQLDDPDYGGSLRLRWSPWPRWRFEGGVVRQLRIPTLLETHGRRTMDFADGVRRDLVGNEELTIERQDLAHAGVRADFERWRSELRLEGWSLTRGVGQRPVGDELHFVGDAELRVQQLRGESELLGRFGRGRWMLGFAGHRVLGDLRSSRGRGSGWPTYGAQIRARFERPFFSPRNALIGEFFWKGSGPRLDDRMAPIGGIVLPGQAALSVTLPAQQWIELRTALRIRDAELYLAWDNLLDEAYSESYGTLRRPRQLRWGLFWTFYN